MARMPDLAARFRVAPRLPNRAQPLRAPLSNEGAQKLGPCACRPIAWHSVATDSAVRSSKLRGDLFSSPIVEPTMPPLSPARAVIVGASRFRPKGSMDALMRAPRVGGRQSTPPPRVVRATAAFVGFRTASDGVRLHLVRDIVRLTDRKRHDRQGRVFGAAGGELAAVRDEQVPDVVRLAPLVHHAVAR